MSGDRIVPLEGVNNFRDYGGYAVAAGGRVKRGLLWRSGHHVAANEADLDQIAALGLVTVIDLRGDSERASNPCRRHATFTAEVLTCEGETAGGLASHLDAADGALTEGDARSAMQRLNAEMPYRPNLVAVLRRYFAALAGGKVPSLVHCYAGKDRTGFAVALTHHLLGVHPDDAMADYLLTNAATAGRAMPGAQTARATKYPAFTPEVGRALMGVHEAYLAAALAAVIASHGSLDAYLEAVMGVDIDVRERIRTELIED